MASLTCLIVSQDSAFTTEVGRVLRSGKAPVSLVVDESSQGTSAPDLIVVDARASTPAAMSKIEQFRLSAPLAAIFAVALEAEPDLILQAMRAGANEFLTWPPSEDKVHEAVRRATGRLKAKPGTTSKAMIVAFVGAKGGAGTTTLAVNSGVEIARLSSRPTVIVDLQAGFGEVGLFLGIRSKYSILDALDNIHRLDREFLSELVVRHKSGLDVLAGSDQFDRPAASENAAFEELLRFLGREYEYIVLDAGFHMNTCAVAALFMTDQIYLVVNPDVPSVRNAQRVVDQVRRLGACGERVRLLLNRGTEPLPIPRKQIEDAIGHHIHHMFRSDYRTVSAALNSGVPLALMGGTEIAKQVNGFARRVLNPTTKETGRRSTSRGLGLQRVASLW